MKKGDVVRLIKNPSGQHMTVEKATGNNVACVWFDTSQKLQRATFKKRVLELIVAVWFGGR